MTFFDIRISQSNLATYCRWNINFCGLYTENVSTNQPVKEFWKSVHICRSYHQTVILRDVNKCWLRHSVCWWWWWWLQWSIIGFCNRLLMNLVISFTCTKPGGYGALVTVISLQKVKTHEAKMSEICSGSRPVARRAVGAYRRPPPLALKGHFAADCSSANILNIICLWNKINTRT